MSSFFVHPALPLPSEKVSLNQNTAHAVGTVEGVVQETSFRERTPSLQKPAFPESRSLPEWRAPHQEQQEETEHATTHLQQHVSLVLKEFYFVHLFSVLCLAFTMFGPLLFVILHDLTASLWGAFLGTGLFLGGLKGSDVFQRHAARIAERDILKAFDCALPSEEEALLEATTRTPVRYAAWSALAERLARTHEEEGVQGEAPQAPQALQDRRAEVRERLFQREEAEWERLRERALRTPHAPASRGGQREAAGAEGKDRHESSLA